MQIIAHGISTGALFIIAGQLYERMHTRDMNKMGGLWDQIPVMGGIGLIFVMASLGLPGLGNFIAEFLTLTGVFKSSILFACLSSVGLIAGTIYALRIMQKVFYGRQNSENKMKDLSVRESITLGAMVIIIICLGMFPQTVIRTAKPSIMKMLKLNQLSFDSKSRKVAYELFNIIPEKEVSKSEK
jgi:NADH-quinone oxidoreductase subunit M